VPADLRWTDLRRTIVVAATPTSNGDLHVGHLAGPYLAGDVYARYLSASGRPVVYTTCTDDSQSYVLSTARRRGVAPESLCAASTAAIGKSLAAMGISVAGLPPVDGRYRAAVLEFVTALHAAGRFRLRTVRLPFATRAGTYLYDGLVVGTCPTCLAASSGGVCEACGHPNNFDELLDPRYSLDPTDPVAYRDVTLLVLPLEDYRDRLTAYYAERERLWRPHAAQLIRELLAAPLPDVPVTIPGMWGIPAPFPQTPGQVLYPWIEAMPACMYSTWWSLAQSGEAQSGEPGAATDEQWRASMGPRLVYFHGFDNVYHWGLVDLALLMAHGDRYALPASNVCNEFYELAGEKFSTSRNHLIWGRDLLATVPRDLVRFYLALTAPEFQRTSFSSAALRGVTTALLVEPWNRLAALAGPPPGVEAGVFLPTTEAGRRRAATIVERFRLCYELPTYSLSRAAETVAGQLGRLREAAEGLAAGAPRSAVRNGTAVRDGTARLGDLLLEIRALLACAAPILVDVAGQASAAGVELRISGEQPSRVAAFELPTLPAAAGSVTGLPAAAAPAAGAHF
jgi:methionyl-tRNA synthetase